MGFSDVGNVHVVYKLTEAHMNGVNFLFDR